MTLALVLVLLGLLLMWVGFKGTSFTAALLGNSAPGKRPQAVQR